MTDEEKSSFQRIIRHCRMFEYGSSRTMTIFDYLGIYHPLLSTPPEVLDYNVFAGIHLMYTMFLVDKQRGAPMGGFIYKILLPLGLVDLLEPIRVIMDTSLGPITFGEFTRLQREKLCTHGDLSFDSLAQHRHPRTKAEGEKAKLVPFDPEALEQYEILMERLISEVGKLREKLELSISK